MYMDTLKTVLIAAVVGGLMLAGILASRDGAGNGAGDSLGALSSPDLAIGGFRVVSSRTDAPIQATSSVVCSIQSPVATSSLLHGSVQFSTATSGATALIVSRSTAPYTLGTILASSTVASGALPSLVVASSSAIFSPSTYLVVSQLSGGILNQSGNCQALWVPLN